MITDEAELRDALRRAERRFGTMIASLREVLFQTDLAGHWTFLNEAWPRMLGYSIEESIGTFYQSAMHPDDRAASLARLAVLQSGEKDECRAVFRMYHRDGSIRWTEITARPLREDDGELVGLTGTLNDVTDRVHAEHELERERRRLHTVIEGSRVGTWERNELNDEAWYSAEWAEMLGYRLDELHATYSTFAQLVHPDDYAYHQAEADRIFTGEAEFFEVQVRMRHKLGHWVWVRSRGRVMEWGPDGRPLIVAGTHTEVTDQVTAEQAVRNSQKLEALGRIAGGIAHDFNNLLGVILGSAELIELDALDRAAGDNSGADTAAGGDPAGDTSRLSETVGAIRSAAERAAALTKRLLDISRQRSATVEVIDVNQAVADLDVLIARALPQGIELSDDLDPGVWPIEVDRGMLADAVLNLAINARDAMGDGGVLTIRTANRPARPGRPDRVALSVTDTGIGMAPDVKARIFEPFFSTKPAGQGTGLGLALAYAFVQQSGGSIDVESEQGHGTTFVLEFPRSLRPVPSPTGAVRTDPWPGSGELVLVVDDEGLLRELARIQLEGAGYRVLTAYDGPSALAVIDAEPDIDLVFSDVLMPGGVSGYDLAATVRTRYPDVKVLLASGFSERPEASPFDGALLTKPYTRADLIATVRAVLDA